MKPSSAKAKGRRLQNEVCALLRDTFHELHPDDITPAVMGETGRDIQLSPAAQRLVPVSIECKNTERLNIWRAIEQAERNAGELTPAVAFRRNRTKTYVAVPLEFFARLLRDRK